MGQYKILAVDDDPIIRKLLQLSLESEGFQVILAADGSEAIETLHNENFDVVITDLQMGEVDGIEVLKKAKDLNLLSIGIVITGNQNVSPAIEAIKIGVDDYLLKPFSLSELLDCVRKGIEQLELNRKSTLQEAEFFSLKEQIQARISMMAHDIRSAVIQMNTRIKLLRKGFYGEFPESAAHEVDMLFAHSANLTALAEEYLGSLFLMKEETGFSGLRKLNFLDDVIEPVLNEVAVDLEEKSIVMDNFIDGSVGEMVVEGDSVQLKAVFRNLFKNAIEYGGNGCTIGFNLEKQANNYYRFSVFNTVSTIPDCLEDKLFTQLGGRMGISTDENGAGMGLCLTKDIINKHGGEMWYEKIDLHPHFLITLPESTGVNSGISTLQG